MQVSSSYSSTTPCGLALSHLLPPQLTPLGCFRRFPSSSSLLADLARCSQILLMYSHSHHPLQCIITFLSMLPCRCTSIFLPYFFFTVVLKTATDAAERPSTSSSSSPSLKLLAVTCLLFSPFLRLFTGNILGSMNASTKFYATQTRRSGIEKTIGLCGDLVLWRCAGSTRHAFVSDMSSNWLVMRDQGSGGSHIVPTPAVTSPRCLL